MRGGVRRGTKESMTHLIEQRPLGELPLFSHCWHVNTSTCRWKYGPFGVIVVVWAGFFSWTWELLEKKVVKKHSLWSRSGLERIDYQQTWTLSPFKTHPCISVMQRCWFLSSHYWKPVCLLQFWLTFLLETRLFYPVQTCHHLAYNGCCSLDRPQSRDNEFSSIFASAH